MLGMEGKGNDSQECLNAVEGAERRLGKSLDSRWWRRGADCSPGIVLLAYQPAAAIVGRPEVSDHVGACREFLLERLAELATVVKEIQP